MASSATHPTLRRRWRRAHHLPMAERSRSTHLIFRVAAVLFAANCTSSTPKTRAASKTDSSGNRPLVEAAPGAPSCPATGLWAQCSVLYRLGRSGIAPHIDSTATVGEKALTGAQTLVVKFGTASK